MENDSAPKITEREIFLRQITEDVRFSHAMFGCFRERNDGGHFPHGIKGPASLMIKDKIFRTEEHYVQAFGNQTGSQEFKARVIRGVTNDGQIYFILSFNDRQGDTRSASHTDYLVVTPREESSRVADFINNDPSILIDAFRKVYPEYDRSKGTLIIDPDYKVISFKKIDKS